MALSRRARAKGLRQSAEILGRRPRAYAVGVVGPNPGRTRLLLVLGEIAVIATTLALLHLLVLQARSSSR